MGITSTGYALATSNDYLTRIVEELNVNFPNMSNASNNFAIVLARIFAKLLEENDAIRAEGYNNVYVATAVGIHLDKAVSIAGIERRHGTKSYGKIKVTKTNDVPTISIAPNTLIETNGVQFQTINDGFVPITTLDPVEIEIASVDVGRDMNIAKQSKFTPVVAIRGLKEMICEEGTDGGSNTETDQELRARYYITISAYSNSSLNGIISEVSTLPEVVRVSGIENNDNVTSPEGLPPHSFELFIEGGSDSEIANSIFYTKPAGIQTHGDVKITIPYNDVDYVVSFSRFKKTDIYYAFNIKPNIGSSISQLEIDIKNALKEYTEKSSRISHGDVVGYLFNNTSGIGAVNTIAFSKDPNPTKDETIEAELGYAFETTDDKISITFEGGGVQ